MTLALYGKSNRRKGVLIALALFSIVFALVSGVASQRTEPAKAQVTAGTVGTPTGTCTNPGNAITSNDSRATCSTQNQFVEALVTPPAIPAWATDISFRVALEAQREPDGGNATTSVLITSNTITPASGIAQTVNSNLDGTVNIPGGGTPTCGDWGATWTPSDLAGLKVKITKTNAGDPSLLIDDIIVSVCYGARTLNSATVGGSSSVTVAPSSTIVLLANVTTLGGEAGLATESDQWRCTSY